jgi:hypothetical protein
MCAVRNLATLLRRVVFVGETPLGAGTMVQFGYTPPEPAEHWFNNSVLQFKMNRYVVNHSF